jgi:UPF0042 nucleotide-binding protein
MTSRSAGDSIVNDLDRVAETLVITGMSGAGKSTAARALEDLGWYVVDNLPPQLIPGVIELATTVEPPVRRVAVVVDVRGVFFRELSGVLQQLADRGPNPRILFVDATDEALVRRFESVRRPHPGACSTASMTSGWRSPNCAAPRTP